MAVTVVLKQENQAQANTPAQLERIAEITFDSNYETGGEALTPSDYGMTHRIEAVVAFGAKGGYVFDFDVPNQKLLAYYGNYDAADGPLIEVPNTTDLSSIKPMCIVKGW